MTCDGCGRDLGAGVAWCRDCERDIGQLAEIAHLRAEVEKWKGAAEAWVLMVDDQARDLKRLREELDVYKTMHAKLEQIASTLFTLKGGRS